MDRVHVEPVGSIQTVHQEPWATVLRVPLAGVRRPPTEGRVGEPWHPRVSVPMRPAEPARQGDRLVASVTALAVVLVLSGVLLAKRAGWRARPRQAA
jgi:hypothetical protein